MGLIGSVQASCASAESQLPTCTGELSSISQYETSGCEAQAQNGVQADVCCTALSAYSVCISRCASASWYESSMQEVKLLQALCGTSSNSGGTTGTGSSS